METECYVCLRHKTNRSLAEFTEFITHMAFEVENYREQTHTIECLNCHSLFAAHRFTAQEMHNIYSNYRGNDYNKLRIKYEPHYLETSINLKERYSHLPEVEQFIVKHMKQVPETILDFGGSTGLNTPFKDQSKVTIHEFDSKTEYTPFNLVVCSHVLEHVSYPFLILLNVKKFMDKNSYIYIEVPYEKHFQDNKDFTAKTHWHEHITFFTPYGFKELIYLSGFRIIDFTFFDTVTGGSCKKSMGAICVLR